MQSFYGAASAKSVLSNGHGVHEVGSFTTGGSRSSTMGTGLKQSFYDGFWSKAKAPKTVEAPVFTALGSGQLRSEAERRASRGVESIPVDNPTTLPTPCDAVAEDSMVDLKHLSFSDWLASVSGSSVDLQQYLPTIQESYDTVSQIATTYTIVASKNGGEEKTLDPQLFEDFGILPEHQAFFHSWFVRFCGLTDDPSTPHFGPEGRGETPPSTASPPTVAETTQVEMTEAPAESPTSGMFDFDELEEVDPCEDEIVTDERLEANEDEGDRDPQPGVGVAHSNVDEFDGTETAKDVENVENEGMKEDEKSLEAEEPRKGGGFFDFDDLEVAEANG